MLGQLADWNVIHGEAIFGTRPWLVYGGERGQTSKAAASRRTSNTMRAKSASLRKGSTLYAFRTGLARGCKITIRSLAKSRGFERQPHQGDQAARISRQARLEPKARMAWW